jgi:hypothetical protein
VERDWLPTDDRIATEMELPEGPVFFETNSKGKLEIEFHPVLKMLRGIKDAERIRKCRVCEKLFWAGRSDKWCCSPRCLGLNRIRQWRTPEAKARRAASRKHRQYLEHRREGR